MHPARVAKPSRRARAIEHRWGLPYGWWTCPDGRVVLFDRRYRPIRQRLPDGTVTAADPAEWVKWVKQEWFYDDGTPEKQKLARALAALAALEVGTPLEGMN